MDKEDKAKDLADAIETFVEAIVTRELASSSESHIEYFASRDCDATKAWLIKKVKDLF